MKYFSWNEDKNVKLKIEREIGFEDVVNAFESGNLLDIVRHPNQKQHPKQKVLIVNINNYVFLVPFIEDEEKYFLKTIFPSRKMTKKYLIKRR